MKLAMEEEIKQNTPEGEQIKEGEMKTSMIRKGALLCSWAFFVAATLAVSASATTWHVGPTRTYKTPCQAIAVAAEGDTIMIDYSPSTGPGVGYYDDTCAWTTNNLTLIGVRGPGGARPVLNCAGLKDTGNTGHLANWKGIWNPEGNNTVIKNLEFENARVSLADGANGAGIRQNGVNLTVVNCYFHDNQMGILESNIAGSNIVIRNSEFYHNGAYITPEDVNNGYWGHNVYIGHCSSLVFEFNYSHDVAYGHLLKTRAAVNYILYNRITQETGTTTSIEVDIPNGGTSYVIGNEIQKAPKAGNQHMLEYLEEGTNTDNPGYDLYVVNNTFVNQYNSPSLVTFVNPASPAFPAWLQNNIFYGGGTVTTQASSNLVDNYTVLNDPSMFVDFNKDNYHLSATTGSPPIDAGSTPGNSPEGFTLVPVWQYVQEKNKSGYVECEQPRTTVNVIDIGAYEFDGGGTPTCM